VQSASVGTPRWSPCFPPTAAAIQRTALLFLEQRLAQAPATWTWPCYVFFGPGSGPDQLALLITRGWPTFCWPIRDSPSRSFSEVPTARRRPARPIACKMRNLPTRPWTYGPLQGVGNTKWPRGGQDAHHKFAVNRCRR